MKNDPQTVQYLLELRKTHIDPSVSHPLYASFVGFLSRYEDHLHYPRFAYTAAALANHLGSWLFENRDVAICETGDLSILSRFLIEQGYSVAATSTDLRYRIDRSDNSADLVLSLEVLEHIKDQTESKLEDLVLFNGSGVKRYVSEIRRILKPGGMLLLTTPNPASLRGLLELIEYRSPMVFREHIREYTKSELLDLFKAFDVIQYTSFYCYFDVYHGPELASNLAEKIGWDPQDRGDCHFLLLRKPGGPDNR